MRPTLSHDNNLNVDYRDSTVVGGTCHSNVIDIMPTLCVQSGRGRTTTSSGGHTGLSVNDLRGAGGQGIRVKRTMNSQTNIGHAQQTVSRNSMYQMMQIEGRFSQEGYYNEDSDRWTVSNAWI